MKLRVFFLFLMLLLTPFQAFSSSVVNTNEGIVDVVQNQSEQRRAFAQVLVKMTGSTDTLAQKTIRSALRQAGNYILSYEYFIDRGKQKYKAVFDRQKVELLLRSEGQPLWGPRRPDGLLWLGIRDESLVSVVSESEQTPLNQSIFDYAASRGVRVLLPLMDLDDQLAIAPTDVWAMFMPVIDRAGERYNTEFTIAARIVSVARLRAQQKVQPRANELAFSRFQPQPGARAFDRSSLTLERALNAAQDVEQNDRKFDAPRNADLPDDMEFAIDWTIQTPNDSQAGRFFGQTPASLVEQLIDTYADTLGARYAIVPSADTALNPEITVSNIRSLSDIATLVSYLKDLTVVQSTSLVELNGNVAVFDVSLIGSLTDLNNTLSLDQRLSSVVVDNDYQTEAVQLHYFWKG